MPMDGWLTRQPSRATCRLKYLCQVTNNGVSSILTKKKRATRLPFRFAQLDVSGKAHRLMEYSQYLSPKSKRAFLPGLAAWKWTLTWRAFLLFDPVGSEKKDVRVKWCL